MFTIVADTVDHKPSSSGARSHDFLIGGAAELDGGRGMVATRRVVGDPCGCDRAFRSNARRRP